MDQHSPPQSPHPHLNFLLDRSGRGTALARNPQYTTSKSAETAAAAAAAASNIMCVRSADIAESDKFAIIKLEYLDYLPPPRATPVRRKALRPGREAIYSVK